MSAAQLRPSGRIDRRFWPGYRTVWRWHFYAGLFCIPFVLFLSLTGSIYLFRPQVEAWLERGYDNLTITGTRAAASAQVSAALAAVPGSVLNAYELPSTPSSAVRVLVGRKKELIRVYVHPHTLAILGQIPDDNRLMRRIFHLHGELLLGDRGSMIVELAASWAIVMLLTGLYLWWPRNTRGLAGVIYPRIRRDGRIIWRDLHAVTGMWVSIFALFMLLSGLPWSKSWGNMLKQVRSISSIARVRQDWTTGSSSEMAERMEMNSQAMSSEHAEHQHSAYENSSYAKGGMKRQDYTPLDRLVPTVEQLHLAAPVLIAPPSQKSRYWTARSDAANRTLRSSLVMDGSTGTVRSREYFWQHPLIDRLVGIGVSAHEGQLFGWPNQMLGLFTAMGLILVGVSALVLWWRRRQPGTLGAPQALEMPRFAMSLVIAIALLALFLPMFGISLIVVLLFEHWLLRRWTPARDFLGLNGAPK